MTAKQPKAKLNLSWNTRRTVGLIIGVVLPLLVAPLVMYLLAWRNNYTFNMFWDKFLISSDAQAKMLSLSVIANLGVFYLFLNKERYDIARGIIIGSALYLIYVIYLKFF